MATPHSFPNKNSVLYAQFYAESNYVQKKGSYDLKKPRILSLVWDTLYTTKYF